MSLEGLFGLNYVGHRLQPAPSEVRAEGAQSEVGSEELGREYRRVAETWVKKPLPDF